jgi:hypothetical protein
VSLTLEQLQMVHESARAGDLIEAANLAFAADGLDIRVDSRSDAIKALRTLEGNLADENEYLKVSVLLLGNVMFDSRPQYVRDVFAEVIKNHKLIILGSSSSSKTYSCGVLFYLYWRNDPYWTQVILAGPSEDHLYGNLFSHVVNIHKASVIPITEDDARNVDINETDMFIAMHDALPEMRIRCVLCKQNQISATGLRGHKPKPIRRTAHPRLGFMTRVYELIDEGTHVSPGAFEDIKTTEASINPATDSVKIVMACNPEGITYRIVELAEPPGGWDVEQVDTLYKWVSEKGYPVLRLDGKLCENVVQRKMVYEGLISYEAFLDFLKSGEHSGPYWAKGRGFPPLKDNAWTILPPAWMQSQRGEPIYVGEVKNIGAEDTALNGGDKALWGVGRWGEAAGWTKLNGEIEWFVNRANPDQRITKYVMVLDQIFQLPKSDNTVVIMQELMGRAKQLEIPPENVVMDKGGNASGVWSHATTFWGNVLGIDSGERATEEKVLADDKMIAYDLYERMATQLWFVTKRWLDPVVGAVFINPIVPTAPLFTQMTTRRYRNVKGGKVQVEPKHEYRARNGGVSPDEADVLNLMVAWCHQRGGVLPGIMEAKKPTDDMAPISLQTVDINETLAGPEWAGSRLEIPE